MTTDVQTVADVTPTSPQVRENALPADASVVCSLSEDTVLFDSPLVGDGPNKLAMYTNPATGREEMLFIDTAGALQQARHTNAGRAEWEVVSLQELFGGPPKEVVTAVHPSGIVFAFVISGDSVNTVVSNLWLSVDGTHSMWAPAVDYASVPMASNLAVQYTAARGGVFVTLLESLSSDNVGAFVYETVFPAAHLQPDEAKFFDSVHTTFPLPSSLIGEGVQLALGVEGSPGAVTLVRAFAVSGPAPHQKALVEYTVTPGGQPSAEVVLSEDVDTLVGVYPSATGVGCVGFTSEPAAVVVAENLAGGPVVRQDAMDVALSNGTVWLDSSGTMQPFGTDGEGNLRVIHQTGVRAGNTNVQEFPAWDSATDPTGNVLVVSRPLLAGTDLRGFSVDPWPGTAPRLGVCFTGQDPTQVLSVFSQDPVSTNWAEERVWVPGTTLRTLTRYKAKVTLKDAYGAPVPAYPVTLSADAPVEVEVPGGELFRVSPNLPAKMMTDFRGQLTLKVVARDLAGVALTVSAKGLPNAATVNPATDVQRFLSGTGTLPNQPAGVSTDLLKTATTSDGRPVFPAWANNSEGVGDAPTPEQFLDFCDQVYNQPGKLGRTVPGPDGTPVPVRMITHQTWDPDRPAYLELTSEEDVAELAAARAARAGYGDTWVGAAEWTGDIWQAVTAGLADVAEISLDLLNSVATVTLNWAQQGGLLVFQVAYDTAEAAALLIEAFVRKVGGVAADVLDWLKWLLDLKDVFDTKNAMLSAMTQWTDYLASSADYAFNSLGPNWFQRQAEPAKQYLLDGITLLSGSTISPDGAPGSVATPAGPFGQSNLADSPHCSWAQDLMVNPAVAGAIDIAYPTTIPPGCQKAMASFTAMFAAFDDPSILQKRDEAIAKLAVQFLKLFDPSDPMNFARIDIAQILAIFSADVLDTFAAIGDFVLDAVHQFVVDVIACMGEAHALPLVDSPLLTSVWTFVCNKAGVTPPTMVPTVGDFYGFMAAFPMTLAYKAYVGQAPFPGGTFPTPPSPPTLPSVAGGQLPAPAGPAELTWFPEDSEHYTSAEYPVPSGAQFSIQALVGISTMCYTATDAYLNLACLENVDWMPENVETNLVRVMAIGNAFAFGIGDLPVFWGVDNLWDCPSPSESPEWAWWGEYFLKAVIYIGDFYCAIIGPYARNTHAKLLGSLQHKGANSAITALSFISVCFSVFLGIKEHELPTATYWLWTQITNSMSSLTSFVRDTPYYNRAVAGGKTLVDAGCDLASGGSWAATGFSGLFFVMFNANLAYEDGKLPDGKVGDDWSTKFSVLAPSGIVPTFGPYGWTILAGELPEGLEFHMYVGIDNASSVQLSGHPTTAGDYGFTVLAADSFDPNATSSHAYTLHIAADTTPEPSV